MTINNNVLTDTIKAIENNTLQVEIKGIPPSDFPTLIDNVTHQIILTHFLKISPTMYEINNSIVYYDIALTYGDV